MNRSLQEMDETLARLNVDEHVVGFAVDTYGYNQQTFEKLLYWATGYRSFDQLEDSDA